MIVFGKFAVRVVTHSADTEHTLDGRDGTHRHLVAGERSRLIRADHRHRAQRFDRRQASNDGVAPCHALYADGEGDSDDGGQTLGNGGHRQADGGEEHFGRRVTMDQHAESECHAGDNANGHSQPAAELRHLAQQRCAERRDPTQHGTDAADLGDIASGYHHARGLTPRDQRSRVPHRVAITDGCQLCDWRRGFFGGHRFTGEHRLIHAQLLDSEQAQVGRYPVA